MAQIAVSNLTFCYEGQYDNIFTNVSFSFDTQWRLGLVGRNGRGKTTLLKLLMNQYSYQGSIIAPLDFCYFPLFIPNPEQPAAELFETISDAPFWRLQKECSRLSLTTETLYRPLNTLSGGERSKLQLAMMFCEENKFMLIDEPTNHLDETGRAILGDYLSEKSGFLLVSHDRRLLDCCTDHTLAINQQSIQLQKGNFSCWYENKQKADHFEITENERLKKEIRHLTESAKRTASWSHKAEKEKFGSGQKTDRGYLGHKAAKMMKRAKAAQTRKKDAVRQKSSLLKNIETCDSLKLSPLPFRSSLLVHLRSIVIQYQACVACECREMSILQGERVALRGSNGCGKSSLLKLIAGEPIPYSGMLEKSSDLIVSYVPQTTDALTGNLIDYANAYQLDVPLFLAILRKLNFSRVQFEKDMQQFSSGQKKKVLLARSLCERAHLYIWDEPLNYIDIFSRMQIESLLLQYRPTLLFVEHDAAFADKIATRSISLSAP